jgi:hypothetical protein
MNIFFSKSVSRIGNLIIQKSEYLPNFSMRNGYQKYIKIGKYFIFLKKDEI